jgi:uncharacterized protein YjbJ (UPF0337 family)
MQIDVLVGLWRQFVGDLVAEWGRLVGNENIQRQGEYAMIVGVVQARNSCTRRKAEQQVNEYLYRYRHIR